MSPTLTAGLTPDPPGLECMRDSSAGRNAGRVFHILVTMAARGALVSWRWHRRGPAWCSRGGARPGPSVVARVRPSRWSRSSARRRLGTLLSAASRGGAMVQDWARPVVHWEIEAKDPERQKAFYADMFNWGIGDDAIMNIPAGIGG